MLKLLGGHRQTGSNCRDRSSSRSPCGCPDSSSHQAHCHPNCENRLLCCEHSSIAPNPCYQGICVSRGHEHCVASSPTVKDLCANTRRQFQSLANYHLAYARLASQPQYQYTIFPQIFKKKKKARMCARTHAGRVRDSSAEVKQPLLGGHRQTGANRRDRTSKRTPRGSPETSTQQAHCHPNCENRNTT